MNGWEHGVDDLFEVIVYFGLAFLGVGSNTALNGAVSTCIRSRRRLTRSKSGSSEVA